MPMGLFLVETTFRVQKDGSSQKHHSIRPPFWVMNIATPQPTKGT